MRKVALADILREISGGLDLYLSGLTICTLDMRPMWQHRVLNLRFDAEFDLGNLRERLRYFQLAEATTAFFSFMGSLVVKRARWDAIPFDDLFDRSLWAHVQNIYHDGSGTSHEVSDRLLSRQAGRTIPSWIKAWSIDTRWGTMGTIGWRIRFLARTALRRSISGEWLEMNSRHSGVSLLGKCRSRTKGIMRK